MLHTSFEKAFHPDSIAIVGVSRQLKPDNKVLLELNLPDGITTLKNLIDIGFRGRLYPINPHADKILGLQAYPTVSSLPETVDLVIITVPNKWVPDVLEDCIKAGALNVHIMTSGFGETGQEDDEDLEKRVREIAARGGLRIIGPNCVGLQVPSAKLTTSSIRPQKPGITAFISQSGGHLLAMTDRLRKAGIGFSKMISYGNAFTLDSTDFLEYLRTDPETEIITGYLEGVKDGKKLLNIVNEANKTKPVIICKGGLTESGARAAFSHTGSLGGSRRIWDAFFNQTKAIQVHNLDELTDMIITFLCIKAIRGNAAAVFSMGGGSTVLGGDICANYNISVPQLSPNSMEQLVQSISLVNRGLANPFDVYDTIIQPGLIEKMFDIINKDPAIDFIIIDYPSPIFNDIDFIDRVCSYTSSNNLSKPIVFAENTFFNTTPISYASPLTQRLLQNNIPIYPSLERACLSISRFLKYRKFRDQIQ